MKTESTTEKFIPLICATFILILELVALYKGMNGIALSISIGALAGIGGYTVKSFIR
jgi:hypothetical protein